MHGPTRLVLMAALMLTGLAPWAAVADEAPPAGGDDGWISLFDGQTLDGWTASEHQESCRVEDGMLIIGGGGRSHLFYTGPVEDHDFKNFELKLDVKTEPGANSGVYIHTQYQDEGWPSQGYEAQVNNTQADWRRTGSLYAIEDVRETSVDDDQWFEYHILVEGKTITLKVDGQTTVEYTEPDDVERPAEFQGRKLSSGTIALQAHDPQSTVYYRNIRIRPLP